MTTRFTRRTRIVTPSLALAALAVLAGPALAGSHIEVGEKAPDFTLTAVDGKQHALSDYTGAGKIVVLEWFNPDCPFIKKHHATHETMNELHDRYADQGVVWLAINSGAPGKQGAGLDRNQKAHEQYGMHFPLLLDEKGEVGRLYGAKTTPHMYVIDAGGTLRYAGAIDDNRDPYELGETNHVDAALSALLAGREVETTTSRPYGCSVKYAD